MFGFAELIVLIILLVAFIFLIRLFGAWMLRIDEVIALLKSIDQTLKRSDNSTEAKARRYDDNK